MTGITQVLVGVVVWGALSFGAVYPWGYWPLAAACASLGIWTMSKADRRRSPPRSLLLALVAVAVAIGIQLIPLPYDWFTSLAPSADRLLSDYSVAYGVLPPAWHTLSVAPASTLTVLGLFVALALCLLGLSALFDRVRLDVFASALALFGIGLSLFGVVQLAFVTDNKPVVYGLWRTPEGALPFGPFINKNHYAGWMVMALPVVLGYFCAMVQASWRAQGRRWRRWLQWATSPEAAWTALTGFCAVAMSTSIVLTRSRSGIAAFAVVLVVLGGFIVRRATGRLGRVVAVLGVLGLLSVAVVWAGSDATTSHFAQAARDLPGRLSAWHDTARIIRNFPWFGSGLGTYWMAMLVYQSGPRDQIFFQAHNDYLQLAAEGGLLVCVPAASAILILAAGMWRRIAAREDVLTRWIRAGTVAGLVGIAAQSTVEFSLQLPGNAALCAILLALAIHRPSGRMAYAHRL